MEKINCPICNNDETKTYLETIDYTVSHEKFSIEECLNCGFLFTNPRPTENEIGKYYESENYVSHSNTTKGIINKIYHYIRTISLKQKCVLIKEINNNKIGKVFDFGCGTGYFLKECLKNNWKVEGLEINDNARKLASINIENNIYSSIDDIKTKSNNYDIVTAWHVLEHVHNLNDTLNTLKNILTNEGKLIIAVPNCNSYDSKYYNKFWAAYDVPRHLYHFTQDTMMKLCNKIGLEIVKTVPMKFDSYYVSMLSEKYKYKNNNFLKAFTNGLASNYAGKNNNNNYSSIIYIIKKK